MSDIDSGYCSMYQEWKAHLLCGRCGKRKSMTGADQRYILQTARRLGWRIGKKVLCPDCSGKPTDVPEAA